jgi:UDP-N-acetyl-D-mannosaminuronate dehydrogenase
LGAGAQVSVHDPYLHDWPELPELPWLPHLDALRDADIVVLATRHRQYRHQDWRPYARPGQLWVDANNLLDDAAILALLQQGCDVIGIGKGHISTLKETLT